MDNAQTATEYLIILAVVLLIAGVLAISLHSSTSIGSDAGEQASANFWKGADVGIMAYSFSGAQGTDAKLLVRNNLDAVIIVKGINISKNGKDTPDQVFYTGASAINPGGEAMINASLSGSANPCSGEPAGYAYAVKVLFSFQDQETSEMHTFNGAGNSLIGRCASG